MKAALLFIGVVALGFAAWGISVALAPVTGQGEAYKQVQSANNRLAQYDHFFALDADIKSQAANAVAAKAQVDAFNKQYPPSATESFTVSEQRNNLQSNLTGLTQLCTSNVNTYNNDAQSYTKGQFLDSKLPPSEDPTVCTAPLTQK